MAVVAPLLLGLGAAGATAASGGSGLLALGIGGAAVSAGSTIASGIAQSKASAYQAQIAQNNAITANQNAEYATQAGQEKAQEQSLKNRDILGKIIAGQAANNIDVNSGSAVDVQATQRETGMLDVLQTENNAALQNYGYRTQSVGYQSQAALSTAQGQQAIPGATFSAAGGLASTAAALGSKFSNFGGSSPGVDSGTWD